MALQQILTTLYDSPALADDAKRLARVKYFEWLMTLPASADLVACARAAEQRAHRLAPYTDRPAALHAFCDLLKQTVAVRGGVGGKRRHRPNRSALH